MLVTDVSAMTNVLVIFSHTMKSCIIALLPWDNAKVTEPKGEQLLPLAECTM